METIDGVEYRVSSETPNPVLSQFIARSASAQAGSSSPFAVCGWCARWIPLRPDGRLGDAVFDVHATTYVPVDREQAAKLFTESRLAHGLAPFTPSGGLCYGTHTSPRERPVVLSELATALAALIDEHVYEEVLDYDGTSIKRGVSEAAAAIVARLRVGIAP